MVACVGSVLLFQDSGTSAWDTEDHDDQHEVNHPSNDGGTVSHDSSGWLRDSNTWLRNGWHPIGTEDESCSDVLSFRGERGEDGKIEGSTIIVDMGVNFRVRNCVDHHVCDRGVVSDRINSTWDENHRHPGTSGTPDALPHDSRYRVSLDGVVQSHGVTADDLTCGGTPPPVTTFTPVVQIVGGGSSQFDVNASPVGAGCSAGSTKWFLSGRNQLVDPGDGLWALVDRPAGETDTCAYDVRFPLSVRPADRSDDRTFSLTSDEVVRVSNRSAASRVAYAEYEVHVWRCPEGSTRAGNVIPATWKGERLDRNSVHDRDAYCRVRCPAGSQRAGREIPQGEDDGWCNDRCAAAPSVSDLRASRTGDWWRLSWDGATSCYDYRASTQQMPMPFTNDEDWWFDTSNFRTPGDVDVVTWNFKWLSVSADHFHWPDAQRCLQSFRGILGWIASGCGSIDLPDPPGGALHGYHRYGATPLVHRIDVTVRGQQLITTTQLRCVRREGGRCVETAPVIQTIRSTPAAWTSPWMCPKRSLQGQGNPHVAESRSLRNIPANVTAQYDRLNAVNTSTLTAEQHDAHRQQLNQQRRTIYQYCYSFTPHVTLNVPDGYRDGQTDATTVEVTFTKQSGTADCPTHTADYTPAATAGQPATADDDPSLNPACVYTVSYQASAADGELRLVTPVDDPKTAAREDQVTADAPQTQATYEEAFFPPRVTINIPDGHAGGRTRNRSPRTGWALFSNVTFEQVSGPSDCEERKDEMVEHNPQVWVDAHSGYNHDKKQPQTVPRATLQLDRRCVYQVTYLTNNSPLGTERTLTLVTPVDDPDTTAREDQVAADDPNTAWDDRATAATYEHRCEKPGPFWSQVGVSLAFGDAAPEFFRGTWNPVNWSDDATRSTAFGRRPATLPPAAADVTNEGALVSLRLSLAACVSPGDGDADHQGNDWRCGRLVRGPSGFASICSDLCGRAARRSAPWTSASTYCTTRALAT